MSDAERVAKLSNAKRSLLELRLTRNGVKMNLQDERVATSQTWSSLVAIQPGGSRPPFFWIHGENSNVFLPRSLGPDQPFYGIFHQSRDGKRARYASVEEMAAHYLEEIRTVQPDGPYFLGGYCIGGTVAFEMARYLRERRQEVALVILVDPVIPGAVIRKKPGPKPTLSVSSPNSSSLGNRLDGFFHKLSPLGPQAKLKVIFNTVTEKSRELPATIAQVGGAVAGMVVAASSRYSNKIVAASIKFAKQLAGRFYYLTGIEPIPSSLVNFYLDSVYGHAARAYKAHVYPGRVIILTTADNIFDPRTGFSGLADGGIEVIEINAKHGEVVYDEPQIKVVADKLKAYLREAQEKISADHV